MRLKHILKTFSSKGFTIPEVVLITGIIGILIAVSVPTLTEVFDRQSLEKELAEQREIRGALETFLQQTGSLPEESVTWNSDLIGFTDLGTDEILIDQWNGERQYFRRNVSVNFRDVTIDTHFAVIISSGPDGNMDTDVFGILSEVEVDDPDADFGALFSTLKAEGDDVLTKFSNFDQRISAYYEAQRRMDAITDHLEAYAEEMRNRALGENLEKRWQNIDNDLPEDTALPFPDIDHMLFVPATAYSGTFAGSSLPVDQVFTNGLYFTDVINDMGEFSFKGANGRISVTGSDGGIAGTKQRRHDMLELMRLLGLPDSYCCHALEFIEVGGEQLEKPFFYFSNPRPKMADGTCGSRPFAAVSATAPRFMGARLVLSPDADVCG